MNAEQVAPVRRVVIAEDEALIRLDLAEMLAEEGYDVVGQAGDGQTAVELAELHRPDLVVLDVKMPRLDGIAAAQRIAEQRIAPVVILTAFSQRDLVDRARDAGAMAYLVKPFNKDDLVPAIEMAVSRFAELQMLEAEVADLTERLETRKAVDRAKGVLQRQLELSEPDAFRWIQKTAMDLRLSMRQVADGVHHARTGSRGRPDGRRDARVEGKTGRGPVPSSRRSRNDNDSTTNCRSDRYGTKCLALGSQHQKARSGTRWGDSALTPHDGGSMIRPNRALRAAVVLATASLVLTACGGGNDDSADSGVDGVAQREHALPAKGDGTLTVGTLLPQTGDLAFLGPPGVRRCPDRHRRHQRRRWRPRQGRRPGQGRLG